jgi:hypothetical protein
MLVKSRVKPLPSSSSVSTYDVYTHSSANTDAEAALWIQQAPPSTRARLPTLVCANATILLALMTIDSI